MTARYLLTLLSALSLTLTACGGGGGVGSECSTNDDCTAENTVCLTQFKGGYCGQQGCSANSDCPPDTACVKHTDNQNYCFLICTDKAQCNGHRPPDVEANCSSNIDFVSGKKEGKACVPPSGP